MNCDDPFVKDGKAFGCGRCLPCRITRRRIWATRIMLEAMQYEDNNFITLTYSEDKMPPGRSLDPKHLSDFMKRLRSWYRYEQVRTRVNDVKKLRFFAVGEYGDESERPHYHVAAFNFPSCRYGRTRDRTVMLGRSCCWICDPLQELWGYGHVFCGTLEDSSAQYIAGYVVKKLTRTDDPRLNGRWPEFSRMSNRPGLGLSAMHEVASQLLKFNLDETQADVPSCLRFGSRLMPIGPYLRRNLRKMIGRDEKAPQATIDAMEAEVYPLRQAAKASSENPSLKGQALAASAGSRARIKGRSKIFKQRKHL